MSKSKYDLKETCKCGASFELNVYDKESTDIYRKWQKKHINHHIAQAIVYNSNEVDISITEDTINVSLKKDK